MARCAFCAFPIEGFRSGPSKRYLTALHKEIAMTAARPEIQACTMYSVYLGGGTPSLFRENELRTLLRHCRDCFQVAGDAEISLEAHPATLNFSKLKTLRDAGVNRLSIGMQSLSDRDLHKLGRKHSAAEADAAFLCARAAGFANIGIDLIYGLPDQTADDWAETLRHGIALSPEHLSIYALSVEAGTLFAKKIALGQLPLPPEETVLSMYDTACETLSSAGYLQYELSNFAKPDFACRHNQLYWDQGEYIGLGVAAHSYFNHERRENTENLTDYIKALESDRLPCIHRERVGPKTRRIDTIIFGLRKSGGLPVHVLQHDPQISRTTHRLIRDGLLKIQRNSVELTSKGKHLADEVATAYI